MRALGPRRWLPEAEVRLVPDLPSPLLTGLLALTAEEVCDAAVRRSAAMAAVRHEELISLAEPRAVNTGCTIRRVVFARNP